MIVAVLYRQLRPSPIAAPSTRILILGAIGAYQVIEFAGHNPVGPADVATAVLGLVVAAALAWPRAKSLRIWQAPDGQWWRRGTPTTVALWAVSFGAHFAIGALLPRLLEQGSSATSSGFEQSTLMLYFILSTGLQNVLAARRVPQTQPSRLRSASPVG